MPEKQTTKHLDILFIINPISGNKDKSTLENQVSDFFAGQDVSFEFFSTTGDHDTEKITQLLEENEISKVVVAGGDGTCNMVGKLLLHTKIKMGIIPLGSANGLAAELDIPLDLEENLESIVKGQSKRIDALRINDKYICLHLSDIGFNARVIDRFEKGEIRGMAGYANSFIGELTETQPASFKLKYDGKVEEKSAFMIVIANATQFGTGAVINPEGKPDDGYFEVVVMNPQKVIHFLEMIVPFYTRRIHTLDFVDTFRCKKVFIENTEGQNVQVDGENIGQPDHVSVEILPQVLEVIVP